MRVIPMLDLVAQYLPIQKEIDEAVLKVIRRGSFINGPEVGEFSKALAFYNESKHVIPCASGTDALQLALMVLDLKPGDEVIVPSFTFVASVEVIALLGLTPVLVDVDLSVFTTTAAFIEKVISPRTKAIIPVHLFGQTCPMEPILELAKKHQLYVIEDNAQSLGAVYSFSNGSRKKAGSIGHIACTSFFPSKNLGGYGDGGALMTEDDRLAEKLRAMVNHGQVQPYHHQFLGVNSRLDTLQAAVLNVKLNYLEQYNKARYQAAQIYTEGLKGLEGLHTPVEVSYSSHVYHQYTLRIGNGRRDALQAFLQGRGIATKIYYPIPLHQQEAFKSLIQQKVDLSNTEQLCKEVLSLPMHTELKQEEQSYIIESIRSFFLSEERPS